LELSSNFFINSNGNDQDEDLEFKFTSAHEKAHEIIQAFGGTAFSWQHKGSS